MCLCYLFCAKTALQLVNRKADFFTKRIDSHNESNRELECSTRRPHEQGCSWAGGYRGPDPQLGPGPLVRLTQIRGDFWKEGRRDRVIGLTLVVPEYYYGMCVF